jgi:hypothetical protein
MSVASAAPAAVSTFAVLAFWLTMTAMVASPTMAVAIKTASVAKRLNIRLPQRRPRLVRIPKVKKKARERCEPHKEFVIVQPKQRRGRKNKHRRDAQDDDEAE